MPPAALRQHFSRFHIEKDRDIVSTEQSPHTLPNARVNIAAMVCVKVRNSAARGRFNCDYLLIVVDMQDLPPATRPE